MRCPQDCIVIVRIGDYFATLLANKYRRLKLDMFSLDDERLSASLYLQGSFLIAIDTVTNHLSAASLKG
jgi:hypothetical protein